jgi:hypothetical protein
MNNDFTRRMTEAARLMREGRLGEATAQIQSALGGAVPAPAPAHAAAPAYEDVIDVQARVVADDRGDAPATGPAAARGESFTARLQAVRAGARRPRAAARGHAARLHAEP